MTIGMQWKHAILADPEAQASLKEWLDNERLGAGQRALRAGTFDAVTHEQGYVAALTRIEREVFSETEEAIAHAQYAIDAGHA